MTTTASPPARDEATIYAELSQLDKPVFVVRDAHGVAVTTNEQSARRAQVLAAVPPLPPESLGDSTFREMHGVAQAYHAGAMANGIASAKMVVALANAGYLASFGAAGVVPARIDEALTTIRRGAPGKPFAVNLIHSPSETAFERAIVDTCLAHGVRCVEASAFLDLTPQVVRYRLTGLSREGSRHRIIAKVSRAEVAERFLRPAPERLIRTLLESGEITAEQAELGRTVPMADDITAEADSGGHTDGRPLVVLLPELIALRDRVARETGHAVRIGAAGGIGTPVSAAAAFTLGASYVVTGSVNQASVEADQSAATKLLLAAAGVTDCEMAPSADMFEMGVDVQVLKRGTMFAGRAKRLYDTYRAYDGIESLPAAERTELEQRIFQRPLEDVWTDCVRFFTERDPGQIERAEGNSKRRMALIFRWYLGLSSGWSIAGTPERTGDYQIWCGPAMGAFNTWVTGTYLAAPANRHVAEIATQIMRGAAFAGRAAQLRLAGVRLPAACTTYVPSPLPARRR
ncbi:PfaD family polyunsaturated fatty acid/polyketide biosynthesis protein [Amycolatopsis sp. K13G38]|uniref:PfaD family polyunsaturated fatty acid/polyketide biosynthesis protein n=1 Tax=Amycolatopsis acididurans TaxID=2724524 RepID=A0ABX1JF52_9PSEU|nr:PfaD family polyunsaturated fatty acid/polyketide biosynthesis protein [Amycolatopsis acididurans]NKQ58326.1 PfaD family polyunsaturated fatty acid/polyketide biosynthesis protein [Amycolatopsis acididurans]